MSQHAMGRVHVPESYSAMLNLHRHSGVPAETLKAVDHEPKIGVLDQEDLLSQGIYCANFVPGCTVSPDALGSCTANANTSALSNVLSEDAFTKFIFGNAASVVQQNVYDLVIPAEKRTILFYFEETHQTGQPNEEWPPTDCGSSGPYIVQENIRLGLIKGEKLANSADSLCSLLQDDGVLLGSPFLNAWMRPDEGGFIDGDGSAATLAKQIQEGVAGGHETYISAIEQIAFLSSGHVDSARTILRVRNSWRNAWGDHGSFRIHLSTLVALLNYIDLRQLIA